MPQQPLGFESKPDLSAENYVVSAANASAAALLLQETPWLGHALVLVGPAASGKTHLSGIWAARHGAEIIPAAGLKSAVQARSAVVEDIESLASEEALFHLYNGVAERKGKLLLTVGCEVEALSLALPDLRSRLLGAQRVRIEVPDDALLGTVLMKQFADRQLKVPAEVVSYLLSRMPRSFSAAHAIVKALDAVSLEQRRNITTVLAREVLESL